MDLDKDVAHGVASALRASWSRATCDPEALDEWDEAHPARGQCGVTALVVQDLLAGDLLLAQVLDPEGRFQGWHYWNRLPSGTELDLTRSQFSDDELVQAPDVVHRPCRTPGRCREQYELLSARVASHLAGSGLPNLDAASGASA
jgi:hypothetical protein